jgi:D-inositol-3-phosphate glycosyltransferase
VVASRAAGAAELIDSGENGLLTDRPWDANAIATHLVRLRDDAGLREKIGAAARAKIEPYTWDEVARRTLQVYDGAADR